MRFSRRFPERWRLWCFGALALGCASASGPEQHGEADAGDASGCSRDDRSERCAAAALPANFEVCDGHDECGLGDYCLPTRDGAFHGASVCVPACETDADCSSGCCGTLEAGERLCGLPADCRPVEVGDPCLSNDDCASGDCRWGGCVIPCGTDEDCGTNLLDLPNACYQETSEDGTVQSACLPGCRDDRDCRFHFEDPFYGYDPDRSRVPLECVQGARGGYCL